MIYISTGYMNEKMSDLLKKFSRYGINNLELSSGIYEKNKIKTILKKKKLYNLTLHNYFPPPLKPFTMNLCSSNDEIFKKTLNLIKKNISNSARIGAKFYSFHAGFLIDPKPSELGKKIKKKILIDEKIAEKKFIFGLNKVSKIAKKKNIQLLIENNVLTKKNLNIFGKNPLLMVSTQQTLRLANMFPSNVKILVDVAHLKVSSKTLGFSPKEYLSKCSKFINGYHISENDGIDDQNKFINKNSWFLPYLKRNLDYYTLEIRSKNFMKLKSQVKFLKKYIK